MKNICYSGGARGADQYWGELAETAGHEVVHYSSAGHAKKIPHRVELTDEQLRMADPFCEAANVSLKRAFPKWRPNVANLLRRNYYQIKDTKTVYAVAPLDVSQESRCQVLGGTAWAIEMAIDRMEHDPDLRIYLLNTNRVALHGIRWLEWVSLVGWRAPFVVKIPRGPWTGIGSREIDQDVMGAMKKLVNFRN